MTREEALKVLETGKRITHIYFTPGEYLYMDRVGDIMTEDGYYFSDVFWDQAFFVDGWSLFNAEAEKLCNC